MLNRTTIKPFFRLLTGLSISLVSAQSVLAQSSLASVVGDAAKGGVVLDARCTACHVQMFGGDGSRVYTRTDRKVKSIEGLMRRVEQCNAATQNGELNADQMSDITAYLNESMYKFDDS